MFRWNCWILFGLKQGFPHLWAVLRAHFGFYAQLQEPGNDRNIRKIILPIKMADF
jgi:hypothetical protein